MPAGESALQLLEIIAPRRNAQRQNIRSDSLVARILILEVFGGDFIDSIDPDKVSLESLYRFRVVESKRFNP